MPLDIALLDEMAGRVEALGADDGHPRQLETTYFDILRNLLEHDGFTVKHMRIGPLDQLDLEAERVEQGSTIRLAADFKHLHTRTAVGEDIVDHVAVRALINNVDRLLIVANNPFSAAARARASHVAPLQLKLLDLTDLRDWIARASQPLDDATRGVVDLSREFLRRVARMLVHQPADFIKVHWRNVEELLAEIFGHLGFTSQVTPWSNDGGKDVVLTAYLRGQKKTYYVELKHWTTETVGTSLVKDFVNLSIADKTDGGLFLATSGFTAPTFDILAEVGRPTALGEMSKAISLCRTFVRAESGLWSPPDDPFEVLSADATALPHGKR